MPQSTEAVVPPSDPDVSVVVIVYNDAARLPTAVRSVLRQSLRNLEVIIADDASTDDTPQIAAELQAEDPRVRYVRLAANSGGCGAPRNAGLQAARGRAVMFLDSDDRFERHACKNLLEALEDNEADVAMGLVRRQYVETGRQTLWYPRLFDEPRVVAGFVDMPELIDEVLSVNKLYRMTFLEENDLTFPDDVHYEDQLWTFQIYHRASRIAIIPENVYLWRIFPASGSRSITQQRQEIQNIRDRLVVHRRLDDYIREHGTPELQRLKDVKFLTNDMRLYLADVLDGDEAVTSQVLVEAEDYLRSIPPDRFDSLPLSLRAAYAMALRHDAEGLRQMMLLDRRNVLAPAIATEDGLTYLTNHASGPVVEPSLPPEAPENRLLVVDSDHLLTAPLSTYHLFHTVTGVTPERKRLRLSGRTFDALGKLELAGTWSLALVVKGKAGLGRARAVVSIDSVSAREVRWHAEVDSDGLRPPLGTSATWGLTIQARVDDHESVSPLFWPAAVESAVMPPTTSRRLLFPISVTMGRGESGQAWIQSVAGSTPRNEVARQLTDRYVPALRRRVAAKVPDLGERKAAVVDRLYTAWRRLPIERGHVVYEANLGTIYGDSPKYVYEAMRRLHPEYRATWVLPRGHKPPHEGVDTVQRGSRQYLRALARAEYWVDNQTFPGNVRKRPEQRYLQTWHGIPLKKMGKDEPDRPLPTQKPDRGVGAWDELVVPNPYFEETFVPAYEYSQGRVRYGTPRNDPLVDGSLTPAEARRQLNLPEDARVVLYAPTFRQDNRDDRVPVAIPFDLPKLVEELGDNTYFLLRPHYLNRMNVPPEVRYRVLDTSKVEDVNVAYVAADVLVTDYSSVMFDFALLRRPIVYYTYDYAQYLATRGTYFDLKEVGPGPFVTTTASLVEALRTALDDPGSHWEEYATTYDAFVREYCGREDGLASERAVRALVGGVGESVPALGTTPHGEDPNRPPETVAEGRE